MNWLKILNLFILQWFSLRLCKVVDIKTRKTLRYEIMAGVVPTTGWDTDYAFMYKPKPKVKTIRQKTTKKL